VLFYGWLQKGVRIVTGQPLALSANSAEIRDFDLWPGHRTLLIASTQRICHEFATSVAAK
jgi:hypothetical protein